MSMSNFFHKNHLQYNIQHLKNYIVLKNLFHKIHVKFNIIYSNAIY